MILKRLQAAGDRRAATKLAALLIVFAAPPFILSGFASFELTLVLVWAVAIVALNMQLGYTGQLSVGANVSFALGAYVTAILSSTYEVPLLFAAIIAVITASTLGLLLGLLTAGLKDLYLAMATMALAVLAPQIVSRFPGVTGGDAGFIVSRPGPPEWLDVTHDQYFYWLVFIVGLLVFLIVRNMVTGPMGRALRAIRDGEMVARTQGIKVVQIKAAVSCLSAGGIATSGCLYVMVVGIISPKTIGLILSINLIVALVVGGAASLSGALVGGLFLQFAPKVSSGIGAELGGILFGLAVVIVVIAAPRGGAILLASGWKRVVDRLSLRRGARSVDPFGHVPVTGHQAPPLTTAGSRITGRTGRTP